MNLKKIYNHKFINLQLDNWDCKTLILGTFNPENENGPYADFYYGRVRESKRGKTWSNKFWPSLSSFVIKNEIINFGLLPGEINSKIKLMKILCFNCLDLINSVETNIKEEEILGNNFKDIPLMKKNNKIQYNNKSIIDFVKKKNVKKVISSWGKGTSLSDEFKFNMNTIIKECPNTIFNLYNLPPFGRPKMKNLDFGEILYNELTP